MEEQDMALIWKARWFCKDMPDSLPKLVLSAKWNSREDIAEMYYLVKEWPILEPEKAMELLDYLYADQLVRKFAVECLAARLDDSDLQKYLLQLVQVLKYESYLDCPLATFLLKRALQNKTIGHYFFWHLRAEMEVHEVAVRFGLLLEAYCRGNVTHMRALSEQVRI
jgi:phosphatidylinositol-4,5-bisphosphate 3-kinase